MVYDAEMNCKFDSVKLIKLSAMQRNDLKAGTERVLRKPKISPPTAFVHFVKRFIKQGQLPWAQIGIKSFLEIF